MGFSQGGMMTFEVGSFLQRKLAGLAILSGRIMSHKQITNETLLQTPIFISHGEQDEVLPIKNYHKAAEYLRRNKCKFESHVLKNDAHKIWDQDNLCTSNDAIFVATGVCDGWIPGVQYNDNSINTWSRIIYVETGEVKTIESVHSLI